MSTHTRPTPSWWYAISMPADIGIVHGHVLARPKGGRELVHTFTARKTKAAEQQQ